MEVNRKKRVATAWLVLGLLLACIIVVFTGYSVGQIIMNVQEQACSVLEAGLSQVSPLITGEAQTAEECVALIKAASPLYMFIGTVFTIAVTGIIAIIGWLVWALNNW